MTKAAAAYLAKVLEEDDAGEVVRFVFGLSGLEPQPSVVLPGDATYEFEGKTILAIDQTMTQMLERKTFDVDYTDDGPYLRLL